MGKASEWKRVGLSIQKRANRRLVTVSDKSHGKWPVEVCDFRDKVPLRFSRKTGRTYYGPRCRMRLFTTEKRALREAERALVCDLATDPLWKIKE